MRRGFIAVVAWTMFCVGCGSSAQPVSGTGGSAGGTGGAAGDNGGGSGGGTVGSGGSSPGSDGGPDVMPSADAGMDVQSSGDALPFTQLVWKKTSVPSILIDSIGGTGEHDVWITGRNGFVFVSAGDDVWTRRLTDVSFDLYRPWGSAPDNVWVAVNANIVLHWTGTWQHEFQGINAGERFRGLTGSSGTDVYLAGGRVLHSVGDGIWTQQVIPGQGSIDDVWALGPNELLAADDDHVYYIKNGVVSPLGRPGLPTGQLRGLWGSSATDIYVIKGAGIAHSSRDGKWTIEHTWDTVKEQDGGSVIWGAGPTEVFVATGYGRLLRSHGDGNWIVSEIDPPWSANIGIPTVGIWGTSATNVYIATGSGFVYHGQPTGN